MPERQEEIQSGAEAVNGGGRWESDNFRLAEGAIEEVDLVDVPLEGVVTLGADVVSRASQARGIGKSGDLWSTLASFRVAVLKRAA